MSYKVELQTELDQRETKELLRSLKTCTITNSSWIEIDGNRLINMISNDYLGLSSEPSLKKAAITAISIYGVGAASSRLICGNHLLYQEAEKKLSQYLGGLKTLIFASGYQTNLGIISAIISKGDVVFSDRYSHASMLDGITLSRGKHYRFKHNDPDHLEYLLKMHRHQYKKALIVTESLFSMDGDLAPLEDLVKLKEKYDALILVDEAHAVGVIGPKGKGLIFQLGLQDRVDFIMGTFSKALGCVGGYIAGSDVLIQYLINKAHPLIYSTALPPADLAVISEAISLVESADDRRSHLKNIASVLNTALNRSGLDTGQSNTHIIPVFGYEAEITNKWAQLLKKAKIAAVAVRPPTVPPHTARLRFTLNSRLSLENVQLAALQIIKTAEEVGLIH